MIYKKKFLFRIVLFAMLFRFSPLSGQSSQYESHLIEIIDIEMVNLPDGSNFDMSSVRSRIHSRVGNYFSQTDFDQDLKRLVQDFDHVDPTIEILNDKLYIKLRVWPKPTIHAINWSGYQKAEIGPLRKELAIKSCSVFDRFAFNKAFHKLKAFYVKKGFFEAELDYDVVLNPECNEVDINITIDEGRAGRIKDIVFEGLDACEEDDLFEKMLTKPYSFLLSWFTNEGTYNEEMIQQDQMVILNYIQNEGYADAKINIEVIEACEDRIIIKITVVKGERYYFGPVIINGNEIYCIKDLYREFEFTQGSPYSPDKIRDTIKNINDLYGRRGYIDASVDFEPSLCLDGRIYSLKMTIEEGEQFRVGMIKVFGNCTTQSRVILHETLLIPGEIFNSEKLQKTEEKLHNIGYFSNVNVYAVKSDGPLGLGGCYRDVHIEVEETGTGNFSAFAGFSTVESIFGGLNVTERNFNAAGLLTCWDEGYQALRGGGEYAHLTTTIGAKSRKYIGSWTKPFFMDTPWAVGFDVERSNNRYISDDYEINAWGLTLHATYQYNQFVKIGWHYRLRDTNIEVSAHSPPELVKEAKNSGLISAVGVSYIYDSTDNPGNPHEGFKSRVDFEAVGLGGIHSFYGLAYINCYYLPICKKSVLKYRADMRFLYPTGRTNRRNVPIDERLFLGGENVLRGFRSYKIGPVFPDTKDPKGGMSMELISVEYAYRFNKRLEGFAFFDAGHLSQNTFEFAVPRASVGYGCRIKIIDSIPPLTLGMGYPLNAKDNSEVKRFFLTVGGRF